MSGRFFTNSRTFVGQDLNNLAKDRTFQPNEFWIVWPEWTKNYPTDMPGEGSGMDEEGWREATEEEFLSFYNDSNAVTHVIQSTHKEPENYQPRKSLAELFGLPPTRSNSRSCKTRNSVIWGSADTSPISSKKIVPPSASSKLPARRCRAPVKAPFSWPNNSDEIKEGGIAAQLTLTKARVAREDRL
jgi:hypothetical protein